jgi:hypothetical protein
MAHFAELDQSNTVTQVIVVNNMELVDEIGVESESKGIAFCTQLFGGNWIQTSYNGNIRKNYAGIGFTYDEALDAFIPPKCHDEAELDTDTCTWNCTNESHKEPSQ